MIQKPTDLNKRILILVPALTARGGITNYYQVLKNEFPPEIEYFERGARTWPVRKGTISELIRAYKDYQRFKKRIQIGDIKLLQSTTSLSISTTIRDGLFLRYAHKRGVKAIAFFRGWDESSELRIKKKYFRLFKYFFFNTDASIVLSEKVKQKLVSWGYSSPIYLETTVVDKSLLKDITIALIENKFAKIETSGKVNLLYLSRVEKKKGLYELVYAFKKLQNDNNLLYQFSLDIYGDGFETEPLKQKIKEEHITEIKIHGFVEGLQKINAFKNAHIFVFPSYGEGMPNAVLEAMGFGLPVITTPVGGVVDFFIPGKNGSYVAFNNIEDIAIRISEMLSNIKTMGHMAINNYELAKDKFSSDIVAARMESIFKEVMNN